MARTRTAAGIAAACALGTLASAQASSWDAALQPLPPSTWQQFDARCLDGSPPAYYYRAGSPTKFKLHIQGGGWCTTLENCYQRSQSALGSSSQWPQWLSNLSRPNGAAFYGLMDSAETNPFGDFSFVWIPYCDGSSTTSNRDAPLTYNGSSVYFRGAAILDAILFDLEQRFRVLSGSTEVIVSGTSAGGLSTYFHAGYIKSRMASPATRVTALADAGFFLDVPNYGSQGTHAWYNAIASAVSASLWNSTLRGPGAGRCLADHAATGDAAMCFFPQYLYSYLTDVDGVFVLQSTYDTANLGICYGLHCSLYTNCNAAEVAAIHAYADGLRHNVTSVVAAYFPARDSYFLTSCFQHEESCRARDWYGITIGGQTPNTTFFNWYTTGVGPASQRVDGPWPSDSSCAPQNFTHGSC